MRFRAAAGRSILEEIRRVRLETAKELLEEGGMKIDGIAYRCGYASSAAFSIFFRAETGIPPSRWHGQRR
jgi:transcriptional regulator GlxA family with amidase domain